MNPSDYIRFDLSDPGQAREAETRFGLRSQGSGKPNLLLVHGGARVMAGLLSFAGEGNEIAFGEDCGFHGEVFVYGDKARADIGGGQGLLAFQLNIYSNAECVIGSRTVSYGSRVWVGEGTRLNIGQGCLFSEGVTIRTTDHHTIFDLSKSRQLNFPKSVDIAADVWLGQQVAVQKGVRIGRGAIVAGNALVTKPVPAFELWGGVPARRIRRNVAWLDSHPATPDLIAARRRELGIQ